MGQSGRSGGDTGGDCTLSGIPGCEPVTKAGRTSSSDREEPGPAESSCEAGVSENGPDVQNSPKNLFQHRKNGRRQTEMLRLTKPPGKYYLMVGVTIYLVVFITFPLILLSRQMALRERIASLELSLKEMERTHQRDSEIQMHRLESLELAVFGIKITSSSTPASITLWQQTRDKDILARISALEQWKLQQEKQQKPK
jgi:hypothetical protein